MNNFQNTKEFLLDLFFPKFCLGCKKEGSYLCQDCRSLLDICEQTYFVNNKYLSGLYFALPYKERHLTKKLIFNFKYEPYLKDLSKVLANILIEHFIKINKNTNEFWENAVLVPVPLDKKKFKDRGYNQSAELAKELSKIIKIPVILNNLVKIKETQPQMTLKKYDREKNLQKAFIIKNPAEFTGKKVFLIDDVYTTGSTMTECAKTISPANPQQISAITIAREE